MVRKRGITRHVGHVQDPDISDTVDLNRYCERGYSQPLLFDLVELLAQVVITLVVLNTVSQCWQSIPVVCECRTVYKGIGGLLVVTGEGGNHVLVVGTEERTGEPSRSGAQEALVGSHDDWDVADCV